MGSLTYLCDDTRSDWNARSPLRERTAVALSRRTEFFNHYIGPGSPNFAGRPHSDCLKQVRDWQAFHQSKGWKDLGYNALVCGHARLIEGRGLEYSGSHCPDHNTSGFGVQFMVAGSERPTAAMYARMRKLYDDLVRLKGGALAKKGHRDGISTDCPGDIVYAWVKAGMPAASGGTVTPTAPTSLRRGDSGPYVVELQKALNARGASLDVDGSFGPATEAAVKDFQAANGLEVDGIAGPATQAALKAAPTPTATTAQEAHVMFLVQQKGTDPVYKSNGFERVHIDRTALGAFQKAGMKVTVVDTAEELAAFGPEKTEA